MASAKLWIEMVIAGSFYAAAALFLLLWCFGIDNLSFLSPISYIAPYLSVGAVFVSYIFGISVHFLLQRFVSIMRGKRDDPGTQGLEFLDSLSDRVYREVKTTYNAFIVLRLAALGAVILGGSLLLWTQCTLHRDYQLKITIVTVVLAAIFLSSYLCFRKLVSERARQLEKLLQNWQRRNP